MWCLKKHPATKPKSNEVPKNKTRKRKKEKKKVSKAKNHLKEARIF
jgi:hypothetical protein